MAELEKSPFENLTRPSGWPEAYHQLQQLIGARGAILFLLLAAALFVWWKWEDIAKRPGAERLIGHFERGAIDKAPTGVLTIAVAHLQDDEGQKQEKLLLDGLSHDFEGVDTLPVDRLVEWPGSGTEQARKKEAEERARDLLKQTGADVLIWGSVIPLGGNSAMRLYWTPSQELSGAASTGKYLPQTETIALPEAFWSDLKQILGLLAQSRLAALSDQPGQYVADRPAPLIAQVRALVESKGGVWKPETLTGVRFSLATALLYYGEQAGNNEPLTESIERYRKVLDEYTRARVPLQWAMTQNNLGLALWNLGERERGTARLEEAVAAYRAALEEYTRARAAPMGDDAEQSRQCASGSGGAGERDGASGGGGRSLSRGAEGKDARARSAPMGGDAEQSRHCA
jgi:Tetratricopeptide repeat